MNKLNLALAALTAFGMALAGANSARAGTIILEGSDAIGFHCPGGNAAACAYEKQTWNALTGGNTSAPILVLGTDTSGVVGHVGSQGYTLVQDATLAAAGPLGGYAAIYFLATGGCCTENDSLITAAGAQTAVSAYLAGGGTVMIENYIGGLAWNFAVDPLALATNLNADVAGVGGGQASSLSCDDGETVTAQGIANGFTQPTVMGCWTHQAYDQSVFTPLGFNLSFFNSPADGGFTGTGPYSSLLSEGTTITGKSPSPEPGTIALAGAGMLDLGLLRRRRAAR